MAGTAWAIALFAAHDAAAATVRLPLLGLQMRLGERQTADREHRGEHSTKRHHHQEHDDDD